MSIRGRFAAPLSTRTQVSCFRGRNTMQFQAQAEVFPVGGLCNECGSQPVQPAQRLLAERIHVEDVFKVEDTVCTGADLASDTDELFHPLSRQLALQDEHWTNVVTRWQSDA
jgi:hypothetical protein